VCTVHLDPSCTRCESRCPPAVICSRGHLDPIRVVLALNPRCPIAAFAEIGHYSQSMEGKCVKYTSIRVVLVANQDQDDLQLKFAVGDISRANPSCTRSESEMCATTKGQGTTAVNLIAHIRHIP
jgi:hypothetical protein